MIVVIKSTMVELPSKFEPSPPKDLWEMELIGDNLFLVGVPIDADPKLKGMFIGALRTEYI